MEKYYIATYPSLSGMGSDWETSLVTENKLRKIIELEVKKKLKNDNSVHYNERFTGTWNNEIFCTDSEMNMIVDDVIQKRLTTCSTYAQVNDLIELPDSVPVEVSEESHDNIIFRLCNEFYCVRDIIVGKAYFRRYKINLTDFKGNLGLENGYWHEFAEFDFKNTAENHNVNENSMLWNEADIFVKDERERLERLKAKLDDRENISNNTDTYDMYSKMIEESQYFIDKFSNLPILPDEYEKHLCRKDYDVHINPCDFRENERSENDCTVKSEKRIDRTKGVYYYPIVPSYHLFGCDVKKRDNNCDKYLSYEELFKKGMDIHCLFACYSRSSKTKEDLSDLDFFCVLKDVFGYA